MEVPIVVLVFENVGVVVRRNVGGAEHWNGRERNVAGVECHP